MKSVLLLVSILVVFSIATYTVPSAVIATVITIGWALAFGRWLGIRRTSRRKAFFGENGFAVNAFDADASPDARGVASFRDSE